jgi:type I restriction enzyme S subunit
MSYVLSTAAARAQKSKGKVKSKVVHSSVPAIKGIVIPVPPLPIQEEIVRILDTFTELTAELTTELTAERTARKRQYEYYRDELFKFCDSSSVKWKSISELGMLERGGGLQKRDLTISGVGCIHYGQIYTFYGTYVDKTKSFVSKELACRLKKIKKNDLLIAITSENIKDVCKCVAWIGEEEIVTGGHTAIFRHSQNPKYISYFFQTSSFFKQKQKIANGTKVIEVSPIKLSKVLIPIRSIEEQNRIVSILDRFDTLCNNLTSDLPAEIEARKKQYEYYRDKLLTFKELKQ